MTSEESNEIINKISKLTNKKIRRAPKVLEYAGANCSFDIFNTDVKEQISLLWKIRSIRKEIEVIAGGPVIIIFHTVKETNRLYSEFSL